MCLKVPHHQTQQYQVNKCTPLQRFTQRSFFCGLPASPCTYALCLLLQETGQYESMLDMVNLLLELGGDLSRVNVVGNDFVAVAGNLTVSPCQPSMKHSTQRW